jgi:hypothetical protein
MTFHEIVTLLDAMVTGIFHVELSKDDMHKFLRVDALKW